MSRRKLKRIIMLLIVSGASMACQGPREMVDSEHPMFSVKIVGSLDFRAKCMVVSQSRQSLFIAPNKPGVGIVEWQIPKGAEVRTFSVGKDVVGRALEIFPDGGTLLVDGYRGKLVEDFQLRFFDLRSEKVVKSAFLNQAIFMQGFDGVGSLKVLVLADGTIQRFDPRGRRIGAPEEVYWAEDRAGPLIRIKRDKGHRPDSSDYGLFFETDEGKRHLTNERIARRDFFLSKDGRYVIAETWQSGLVVWDKERNFKKVYAKKFLRVVGIGYFWSGKHRVYIVSAPPGEESTIYCLEWR